MLVPHDARALAQHGVFCMLVLCLYICAFVDIMST